MEKSITLNRQSTDITFSGLDWVQEQKTNSITVGGCGGIGSYTTFFLTKTGFRVKVYDDDVVEERNLAGQLFRFKDIGETKVDAIYDLAKQFSHRENLFCFTNRITDCTLLEDRIVVAAFDNMKARKILFDLWYKKSQENKTYENNYLFIDARLAAEYFEIYYVRPKDYEEYLLTMFNDEELAETPCARKQTSHVACMCACQIVAGITNFCVNSYHKQNVCEIPFKFIYNVPNFLSEWI